MSNSELSVTTLLRKAVARVEQSKAAETALAQARAARDDRRYNIPGTLMTQAVMNFDDGRYPDDKATSFVMKDSGYTGMMCVALKDAEGEGALIVRFHENGEAASLSHHAKFEDAKEFTPA